MADLKVKCFRCKNVYEVEGVTVHSEAVTDPDNGDLVHYEVRFTSTATGDEVYLADLLCGNKHCSVFGREGDQVFAYPFLSRIRNSERWMTHPDSKGTHYATRTVVQS